jgi:leader peptidase (prepilin peptidase) / N-methyltransferase
MTGASITVALVAGLTTGAAARPLIITRSVPRGAPLQLACPYCATTVAGPSPRNWISAASGRCPACRERLGPAPAVPEALAGIAFVALAAAGATGWSGAAQYWLAACGIALALVDVAVHRLPNAFTYAASAGTLALLIAAQLTGQHGSLTRAVEAAAVVTAVYFLLALTGVMGMGDVKLAPAVGALLGWTTWAAVLKGTLAGFVLSAAASLVLLATKRATMRTRIAFGPWMIMGAMAVSAIMIQA